MPKLSAGIFSPAVAEQEAKKNAASVRAQAAYNKLAKERGSFTRALGEDIIPLGGAIVGGVLGAMAGDPVTGAKMGSAAVAPVGELIAGSGYERAQQAVQEAEEFTHAALGSALRLGMGKRIPDRFFWSREPEAEVAEK